MVCSDVIYAGTGFSEELRNILFRLVQTGEYEVYWIGLQHVGFDVDVPDMMFPDLRQIGASIRMVSGMGPTELYGVSGFKRCFDRIAPDLFMMMGDPKHFVPYVKLKKKMYFPLILYTTLDGLPIPFTWKKTFSGSNVNLAMTEWAMLEFMKAKIPMGGYIHHGVNWQWFTTNDVEKQRLRRHFGINEETTLFINWDVNQFRKRLDALLRCWRDFKPESKNAKLFLHTDSSCFLGFNLENLMEQYNIPRETVLLPEDVYGRRKYFGQGEPIDFHRKMCALGDVYVSTTGGEGFGKTGLEAMSLGMPVIITDYSACSEVCEKGSILVPTYEGRAGRYRLHDKVKQVEMGIVNEEKFVEAMLRLYDNPEERKELGMRAREWSKTFDYDSQIVPAWIDVLNNIDPNVIFASEVLSSKSKERVI